MPLYEEKPTSSGTIPAIPESANAQRAKREAQRLARLERNREAVRMKASRHRPIPNPSIQMRAPAPPRPIPQNDQTSTPRRLRLDPLALEQVTQEVDTESTAAETGWYARFCLHCPKCGSAEDTYAITWNRYYITDPARRSRFFQRMLCDDCCITFVRPGKFFGSCEPKLRTKRHAQ